MNEIEKMYENCNIAPQKEGYCGWDCDCPYPDIIRNGCGDRCPYWEYEDEAKYPPFTAEKQLELIKWLSKRRLLSIAFCEDKDTYQLFNDKCTGSFCGDFATSIATLIQCELDFCTESEQEQIREILE